MKRLLDPDLKAVWRERLQMAPPAALKPKLISGRVYPEFFPMRGQPLVLNLGCGICPQAVTYKNRYRRMAAVDITHERLVFSKGTAAHYRLPLDLCCADVEALPFRDQSAGVILAVDVIEHVRNPDRLLSEAWRVLAAGGLMMVTVPCLIDRWRHLLLKTAALPRQLRQGISREVRRRLYRVVSVRPRSSVAPAGPAPAPGTARPKPAPAFNPDTHKHKRSPRQWLHQMQRCGFRLVGSRATSVFPPLHVLGVKKFWYTNDVLFRLDARLARTRLLKQVGQSLLCLLEKPS